ncbi:MAG: PAS domain S-box protein [Syntrophaceae bacterium]|nr:PAS domain S-box protein [Syntrophaceae bacterium]
MQKPKYEKLSKKDLIEKLIDAEKRLQKAVSADRPARRPAINRSSGSRPDAGPRQERAKPAPAVPPAGQDVKSASESDCAVLGRDGRIRRLYRVVKDIRDDDGNPVFSEGALYEISRKPGTAAGTGDAHDSPGESDRTELICRFKPNGTLTYVNEAYCRYFGLEKADLQGRNVLLSVSEADRENVYSRLQGLRPERPVDTVEYRVENAFGDILWNQWTYRALFDDSGNVLEYQSVGRDITFRKYTQEVLEKRAAILEAVTYAAEVFLKSDSWRERIERVLERFGAAMNASHVFLCENRVGGGGEIAVLRSYEWHAPRARGARGRRKLLRNSKLAVRFSEWVYAKSEGRPIYGSIGSFPEQVVGELELDRQMAIAVVPILSGERWWGFIGFADYTGETEWSEDEIAPLGAASEILGAAIEREERERALRETHAALRDRERFLAGVFDAIQDGIMVVAPDMTILRVNKTVEDRFPHVRPIAGRKCHEAFYGRRRPCTGCQTLKTLETRKAASGVHPIAGADGENKGWVEVFSYPLINHDTGALEGVIEYSRDITERRKAEEARRLSEKRLRQFIDSSRDIIFLKDDALRYLFMNRACCELCGTREEDVRGRTDFEIFPEESARMFREGDLAALSGGGSATAQDLHFNGRFLEVTKFPVDLGEGRMGVGGVVRDVTERRQAEEALRASEERYREMADLLPVGIYEADFGGTFTYANAKAMQLFGYGEDEVRQGIHFLRVIAPEEREVAVMRSQGVRQGKDVINAEYTFLRKDGSRFPGLLLARPLVRDGRIVGSTGVVTDITELKQAQQTLRENEAKLQSILQAAPIGISFGERRTPKWVNDRYQEMTGYGAEELVGNSARILYDSDEEFLRVGEEFYRGIERGAIGTAETRWTRKDGSTIDVLLSMAPVFPGDESKGVVVTALDVTEQKRAEAALRASEARYRELADHLPVGIYEADFHGLVHYANNASLEMFGYSAEEVAAGVNFSTVVAPEDRELMLRNMKLIREGTPLVYQEYTMLRRDGSRFPALTRSRPLVRDGRIAGSTGIVTDISELKQAQEALRKNEALLASILRTAPIGVGMVKGQVLGWVNEGMTALTGHEGHELRNQSIRILYPDREEYERVGRELHAGIRAGMGGSVETRWRRKDGAVIDVHLSAAPIDPKSPDAGAVFTALDITAQKKAARILLFAKQDLEKQVAEQTRELDVANMLLRIELEEHRKTEEALVKSEQLYRAIVEDQTEIICRFGPDGTISFVNEAFCRYFGQDRDRVLGSRYLPSIPREDRKKLWAAYGALAPDRPVFQLELRVGAPDGTLRWLQWTSRAIYDEAGALVEHQGVGRDITDRVRSEQQIRESRNTLRSVFDGISDPLLMVREDMTVIMLNRAALQFLGATLYREMIGAPCVEPFRQRYGQEEVNLIQAAIAGQEPARWELATKGDAARYEEVFVYPVHAVAAGDSMAIIRITDRTRQRLMERELIQSEKLASLGLLVSGIVHEINNPNNFISFNMPILRDYIREILPVLDEHAAKNPAYEVQGMPYADFREDVLKLLENIEHGSTRINATVAKLKEFARKRDDKGARPIRPTEVVERAVAICHTQIRKTVRTFEVDVQQDMPGMVTDPDAIEQPLINLLINAAQAADKPDSRIRLTVRRRENGGGLVIEVEDNGCGMDRKTASRIFDPFFTTKAEGLGTGLGLYISKNLIESAGGSIAVDSEIGRGTTFRVVLPDLTDQRGAGKPTE